jgi:Holliday junction DNA helicase RuvA
MIAHLTGRLFSRNTKSVIIDAGGIGYEVFVPLSTFYELPKEEEKISLYIHTHVREDAILLYGFKSELEKELFLMLISVSGIGPKLGVNILSGIGPEELLDAISRGDAMRLQSIPGVGKKTAERITLELKERAMRSHDQRPPFKPSQGEMRTTEARMMDDALSALVNLGYPPKSAKQAVDRAKTTVRETSLEAWIKEALRHLVQQK